MRQLRPHSSRLCLAANEINRIFRFGLSELLFHAAQLTLHRLPFEFFVVHQCQGVMFIRGAQFDFLEPALLHCLGEKQVRCGGSVGNDARVPSSARDQACSELSRSRMTSWIEA